MEKLHTLEKVNLREIWKHEAHNFTQWLAMEDNISLLLDEIGVTAENIVSEDSAGKFNVDITADEVGTGKKIVIENQLEKTTHQYYNSYPFNHLNTIPHIPKIPANNMCLKLNLTKYIEILQ